MPRRVIDDVMSKKDELDDNLPANYPSTWIGAATLQDGLVVIIRPIRPDDAARLQEGFTHLSADSIYYRFLDSTKQITDEQARRLSNLDYVNQMALVATITEDGEERLVGVARYALVGDKSPGAAETAVIVRDDYHGRGLGTILYTRLIEYAQQHGVQVFVATVHQSNTRIMKFIRRSGLSFDREVLEPGTLLIKIHLDTR
jgi:acetyltransferase